MEGNIDVRVERETKVDLNKAAVYGGWCLIGFVFGALIGILMGYGAQAVQLAASCQ
jgi:galactitol-specific phosphotransferase system IIC component